MLGTVHLCFSHSLIHFSSTFYVLGILLVQIEAVFEVSPTKHTVSSPPALYLASGYGPSQ